MTVKLEVGTLREIGAQVGDVVEMLTVRSGYSVPDGQLTIGEFGEAIAENGSYYVSCYDEHYGRTYRIISRAKPFQPQTCGISHPVTLAEVAQPSLDDQIKAARKDVKRAKKRLRKLRKEKADSMCNTPFRQRPVFGGDDGVTGGMEYWDNLLKQEGDAK